MIRELSIYDLPVCYQSGKAFFAEANLPGKFIESAFLSGWTKFIQSGRGIVFGAFREGDFVGGLGATIYNDLNDGKLVSSECFWYVPEAARGHGLKLLLHYEAWAKAKGVARIGMSHLAFNADKMRSLYRRLGYRALDFNYYKVP